MADAAGLPASPARRSGPRIQAIGLCRFSYLGHGGFKVGFDHDLDTRRAMLYAPDRLSQRFAWFEHVFLPGIVAQTDPDFTLIVLIGSDFPPDWRARLAALVAGVPQIRIAARDPGPHREVCAAVVAEAIDPAAQVIAQFRLDDDDGIAVDYVASLRREFGLLRRLYAETGQLALDHCRGIVLADMGGGQLAGERRLAPYWGCGLTLFLPPDHARKVLDYPHHKVWQAMPTVMRPEPVMFLRGAHQSNDSDVALSKGAVPMRRALLVRQLQARFRVDLAALEAALAAHYARA